MKWSNSNEVHRCRTTRTSGFRWSSFANAEQRVALMSSCSMDRSSATRTNTVARLRDAMCRGGYQDVGRTGGDERFVDDVRESWKKRPLPMRERQEVQEVLWLRHATVSENEH